MITVVSKTRKDETTTIGRLADGSDHQQVVVTKWVVRYSDGTERVFFSDPTDDELFEQAPRPSPIRPSNLADRLELIANFSEDWNALRLASNAASTDAAFTPAERARLNQLEALARTRLKLAL